MSKETKESKPVDVYILAGIQNSGKSTTVRHIINKVRKFNKEYKSNQTVVEIEIAINVKVKILCRTGSLQERGVDSECFRKSISKKNISAVLVPLRTDKIRHLPSADGYIDDFAKKFGWNIKCVAELSISKPGTDTELKKYCDKNKYEYESFKNWKDYPNPDKLDEDIKKFFGFSI